MPQVLQVGMKMLSLELTLSMKESPALSQLCAMSAEWVASLVIYLLIEGQGDCVKEEMCMLFDGSLACRTAPLNLL
jgi:hypothetical protein